MVDEIQRRKVGYVLVCAEGAAVGILTERDILMKIVARDVSYGEPVDKFMTLNPTTLPPSSTIGEAIALMNSEKFRNIPIVAETGEVKAVFSIRDVIDYIVESFPEQVMNLPPRPHQKMVTPEGA